MFGILRMTMIVLDNVIEELSEMRVTVMASRIYTDARVYVLAP
jgi:hypothetical protein